MSGCGKLLTVEENAFSGCIDLEKATISLNRYLHHISPKAFDRSMTQLKMLNLADNRLGSISESLVPWRKLQHLELSGNPWHCDCSLHYVSEVLNHLRTQNQNATTKDKNKIVAIAGKCATPSQLSGTSLHDFLHFKGCEQKHWLRDDNDGSNEVLHVVSDFKKRHSQQHTEMNTAIQNTAAHETVNNEYTELGEEELMRATNATAVIASVCVVAIVLVLAVTSFVIFRCKYQRSHFGSSTSQHHRAGLNYTSDWLQYCRAGMGSSNTKVTGGGIYTDSDSYHYPSSHSPTSTAQLHQATLISSPYTTHGVTTMATPTHQMGLTNLPPPQNLYVQYRDTLSTATTTTLGGAGNKSSPRHFVGQTIPRQMIYNDVTGSDGGDKPFPPSSGYRPLPSPHHRSGGDSTNGSQAADDEYYYVSTATSSSTTNPPVMGDSLATAHHITNGGTLSAAEVRHIPVTVL